jgi:formylglycine-generating enzyme required for sulfatase activity
MITKTQITKGQFHAVMGGRRWSSYTRLEKLFGAEKAAADGITLADVEAFCGKLAKRYGNRLPPGYEFRLPTEAEWEYALWGAERNASRRNWLLGLPAEKARPHFRLPEESTRLLEQAGYTLAKDEQMPMGPVGTKQPNALGVYDMLGNGWELLADRFAAPKDGAPVSDPLVMGKMLGYREVETNAVRGVGLEAGYGLLRGGEFLPGHGFCKRMFPLDAKEMPRDTTFRIVIGPKLDIGKEGK